MHAIQFLLDFTFYYPLFMAYLWMMGGLVFWWSNERGTSMHLDPVKLLHSHPLVSVVVPCFNEADNIVEVVKQLSRLNYPRYEIICVNDGSSDDTGAILDKLTHRYPMLRVVHQSRNQGKAVGLNTAALLANSEYLLCIDGDALLDRNAIGWMLLQFQHTARLGAVTGNPRIRTRSTLLGRLQVGEFSSIIGLIKRAQRIYGRLFTVSGVATMFRRRALLEVGFWSPDMLTEDIDISWKLQNAQWDIRFEPRALCWILMPETLAGLWKQRLRWAMGGLQTIVKYRFIFGLWKLRRMWLIYVEYVSSVIWACAMGSVLLMAAADIVHLLPGGWHVALVPGWYGVLIALTCLLQILISMLLDRRYDEKLFRHYFWMVWYPLVYWMLNMTTTLWAIPALMLRRRGQRAVWVSPDRGVRVASNTVFVSDKSSEVSNEKCSTDY